MLKGENTYLVDSQSDIFMRLLSKELINTNMPNERSSKFEFLTNY